jgi:hypothetical protein
MIENPTCTGIMCSLKISPTLQISDLRMVDANNALIDTGCEITTLYSATRGAQTAFILFSTFLEIRPVSAASYSQTSIYGWL